MERKCSNQISTDIIVVALKIIKNSEFLLFGMVHFSPIQGAAIRQNVYPCGFLVGWPCCGHVARCLGASPIINNVQMFVETG